MTGAFQSTSFSADAFQVDVLVSGSGANYGSGGSGGGKRIDWGQYVPGGRRKRKHPDLPPIVPETIESPVPEYAIPPRMQIPPISLERMAQVTASINHALEAMAARADDEAAAEKLLLH